MPYILNKTNGAKLAILDDASLDLTTNLTFVGRNYSGYGEIVNENFIKLLENFANVSQPTRPLLGQLWFDSSESRLKVSYDGTHFKGLANIRVQKIAPLPQQSAIGDLWFDSVNNKLNVYVAGSKYLPVDSKDADSAYWKYKVELDASANPTLEAFIGTSPIAIISNSEFSVSSTNNPEIYENFKGDGVKRGITLAGVVNGSSRSSTDAGGYYFWGTASEAMTATSVTIASTSSGVYYLPFANTFSGNSSLSSTSSFSYNATTGVLNTVASAARYADLAERYAADAVYEIGTVVVIGGEKEVTITDQCANTAVAGVVSKNPAYMMNSEAGTDETHPYIALKGRVPCKVVGKINRGDLLVTSVYPGYATAMINPNTGAVIGKALSDQSEGFGVIEVLVV